MSSPELPALPGLVEATHAVVQASDYLIFSRSGAVERYATLQQLVIQAPGARLVDSISYRYPGHTVQGANIALGGLIKQRINLRGNFTTLNIALRQAGRQGDRVCLEYDVKFDPWNSLPNQFLRVAGALGMQGADLTLVFHNDCLPINVMQTELHTSAGEPLMASYQTVTPSQYGDSDTYSMVNIERGNLLPGAMVGFTWSW